MKIGDYRFMGRVRQKEIRMKTQKQKAAGVLASRARTLADAHRSQSSTRVVVAVIGRDRPGIMAGVTAIMAAHNANIVDVSQTIMSDLFTMLMLVEIDGLKGTFADLKKELETHGRREDLSILIQREDIFRAMHRV
jgi:ACT domain-containing protein